jgi:hypothetical protein
MSLKRDYPYLIECMQCQDEIGYSDTEVEAICYNCAM